MVNGLRLPAELIELIHEAASMQRWNDHIRPAQGFMELDKQAHKMFFAYVLSWAYDKATKHNPELDRVERSKLIEGALFESLHRVKLTDLKPRIFHRLMDTKGKELNEWVSRQLRPALEPLGGDLYRKFTRYFFDPEYSALEKRILRASHFLATSWEFNIIYPWNAGLYGVEATKAQIESELAEHSDLPGIVEVTLKKNVRDFLDLVGQLRFQKRWAHSPRVPETSVLGHMFVVAVFSYLVSVQAGLSTVRAVNNFLAGLFHDLPEVLTRDIVSPVKRSVPGLTEIIQDIERQELEERLYPLVPEWREEIEYFTGSEFATKVKVSGRVLCVTAEELAEKYDKEDYVPVDGELVKVCDDLAAYAEARLSIKHGLRSRHLEEAVRILSEKHTGHLVCGFDVGCLFRELENL